MLAPCRPRAGALTRNPPPAPVCAKANASSEGRARRGRMPFRAPRNSAKAINRTDNRILSTTLAKAQRNARCAAQPTNNSGTRHNRTARTSACHSTQRTATDLRHPSQLHATRSHRSRKDIVCNYRQPWLRAISYRRHKKKEPPIDQKIGQRKSSKPKEHSRCK